MTQPSEATTARRATWADVLIYGVIPGVVLLLGMAAGYLKWQDSSIRNTDVARIQSVQAAKDSAVVLLSFRPESVDKDVRAAQARLTGRFRDTYSQVTQDVLIPNAKERHVSAAARVPAAASVSASENHAVVLVFVDQTVTVGSAPPADAASSVRVTLDKVGEHWMISGWDPIEPPA
ncbi:hypothetical protein [Mycobacterium branderi]|uniref:Outer membrane protein n=1 Tax=Mycobacterium branderi TaxID=43348 RepID=A0ABN6B4P4_9MYCO|nr:hypothetical protein [Mycobacterium branderi]MCV7231896.1 hypothetical protein [Mycobacterium branderi]BBZ12570.1 outer membrane protein [Mycobacterium branderi]